MCEQYDAATGFDEVIDLTREQAQLLHKTSITRGIDITNNPVSKNTAAHFFRAFARAIDASFTRPITRYGFRATELHAAIATCKSSSTGGCASRK